MKSRPIKKLPCSEPSSVLIWWAYVRGVLVAFVCVASLQLAELSALNFPLPGAVGIGDAGLAG
jgi:hypothetical protein